MEAAWAFADLLTDRATIYGRAANGRATVVLLSDLPCRLSTANFNDSAGIERVELATVRTMYWTADFTMPPDVEVQINGENRRFNVRQETIRRVYLPDGTLAHWKCDLLGSGRAPSPTTT